MIKALDDRESRIQSMRAAVERRCADFARLCRRENSHLGQMIIPQGAVAMNYTDEDFALLGQMIKYAGLYGVQVTILPDKDFKL